MRGGGEERKKKRKKKKRERGGVGGGGGGGEGVRSHKQSEGLGGVLWEYQIGLK